MNIVVNLNIYTWFDKEEILRYTQMPGDFTIEEGKVYFQDKHSKIELGQVRNISKPIYIEEDNK